MFWTDSGQAMQRLNGSYVLYDGKPALIREVYSEYSDLAPDGKPYAEVKFKEKGKVHRIKLEDEKWNNFRNLPPMGWYNNINEKSKTIFPVYIARKPTVTTTHGINQRNSLNYIFDSGGDIRALRQGSGSNTFFNKGYLETHIDKKPYPSASKILKHIEPTKGLAFSPTYCIYQDYEGLRWLYRKTRKVGIFSGIESLMLISKFSYLKEELLSEQGFDIENIKEF